MGLPAGLKTTLRIFAGSAVPTGMPSLCRAPFFLTFPGANTDPSLVHLGLQLPIIRSSNKLRWNFRKAAWDKFSEAAKRSIPTIPLRIISMEESFKRFCGAIFKAATANIPRGRRPVYTPCLDEECGELLEEFERSGDPDIADIADHLLEMALTTQRC